MLRNLSLYGFLFCIIQALGLSNNNTVILTTQPFAILDTAQSISYTTPTSASHAALPSGTFSGGANIPHIGLPTNISPTFISLSTLLAHASSTVVVTNTPSPTEIVTNTPNSTEIVTNIPSPTETVTNAPLSPTETAINAPSSTGTMPTEPTNTGTVQNASNSTETATIAPSYKETVASAQDLTETVANTPDSTETPTPPLSTNHPKSFLGPIIGGVVGGVLFLAIGVALFVQYQRRSSYFKSPAVLPLVDEPGTNTRLEKSNSEKTEAEQRDAIQTEAESGQPSERVASFSHTYASL